jgi:hypothetical protein
MERVMSGTETIEERTYRLVNKAAGYAYSTFEEALKNARFRGCIKLVELAIAEEREACGWRDIASAPKDGSHILLGMGGTDEDCEISTLGWWQEEVLDGQDYMGNDAGFVDHEFSSFHSGRSFGDDKYQYKAVQPTHWMPLPAAPKDEVSE